MKYTDLYFLLFCLWISCDLDRHGSGVSSNVFYLSLLSEIRLQEQLLPKGGFTKDGQQARERAEVMMPLETVSR